LDLTIYDRILLNTSGGKDSQTTIRHVVNLADEQGVDRAKLVGIHCDLGRSEWEGTGDLTRSQVEHYGLRFIVVKREQDLLDQIWHRHLALRARGDVTTPAWPSSTARYCTSDHKRAQARKVMTALVRELDIPKVKGRPVRPAKLLNCMGLRAQESPARAKKAPFTYDQGASGKGTVRQVWEWLPILDWTADQVWADIHASGVPYHRAYDLGMPRLSCALCVLASESALVLAAQHNPELAETYLKLEKDMGHTFQHKLSMADIVAAAQGGPKRTSATDWNG
jgi:3'-phosphoadenosine 5'-phosphosulfate sulfotransferase (PAPS reductase)/FAD synthetase